MTNEEIYRDALKQVRRSLHNMGGDPMNYNPFGNLIYYIDQILETTNDER